MDYVALKVSVDVGRRWQPDPSRYANCGRLLLPPSIVLQATPRNGGHTHLHQNPASSVGSGMKASLVSLDCRWWSCPSASSDLGLLFRPNSDTLVCHSQFVGLKPSLSASEEGCPVALGRRVRETSWSTRLPSPSPFPQYRKIYRPPKRIKDFGFWRLPPLPLNDAPDPDPTSSASLLHLEQLGKFDAPLQSLAGWAGASKQGTPKYPWRTSLASHPPLTTQGHHLCSLVGITSRPSSACFFTFFGQYASSPAF